MSQNSSETPVRMKTIGLLAGMSWESSAEYYAVMNREVNRRLGQLHSAKVLMHSMDFQEIRDQQSSGDWAGSAAQLGAAAQGLERAGADMILICTNTMHKVADEVQAQIGIPLIHLADTTAQAVKDAGLSTVALLGTAFTMEDDFYIKRLEAHGLTVLVPESAEDRAEVHRIIFGELCLGQTLQPSYETYLRIIGELVGRGAEGVILGCTEIELLLDPDAQHDGVAVPLFPTARLHALAAVEEALGE